MIVCANCGTANRDGSRFCNECGVRLDSPLRCGACGGPNPAAAKFCSNCGIPIRQDDASSARVHPDADNQAQAEVGTSPQTSAARTLASRPGRPEPDAPASEPRSFDDSYAGVPADLSAVGTTSSVGEVDTGEELENQDGRRLPYWLYDEASSEPVLPSLANTGGDRTGNGPAVPFEDDVGQTSLPWCPAIGRSNEDKELRQDLATLFAASSTQPWSPLGGWAPAAQSRAGRGEMAKLGDTALRWRLVIAVSAFILIGGLSVYIAIRPDLALEISDQAREIGQVVVDIAARLIK